MKLTIVDIPLEVLLDNLLPPMTTPDILSLTCTNKFFASLCSDDTFWKRRLADDFNFSGAGTARTSGWKFIYRGLFKPRVYVWGEKSHGRLGLSKFPKTGLHGVPFPTELHFPNARIVNLVAGGMSFHALDSDGSIHVWGTLDGTTPALNSDGFSEPGKSSSTPLRLQMPAATRSISCGRLHALSLDSENRIWNFLNWGRPFRLSSPMLADPGSRIIQVECGWAFSSALTQSGEDRIRDANTEMDGQHDKKAVPTADGVIPCVTWSLDMDPVWLPSIPSLPDLSNGDKDLQLVKIAGLNNYLIGLTSKGHVLKFGPIDSESTTSRGRWEYLPEFSDVHRVRENSTFSNLAGEHMKPLESLHITHISANFLHFIAYSTGLNSIVLIGDTDTDANSKPKVIPSLQNKGVISVSVGDYHNVALTSSGKVLTWGAYSAGALGLGDPTTLTLGLPGAFETERRRQAATDRGRGEPPEVEIPTEVRFDHGRKSKKERFCFSASAAGWHTGALVIDLEPDNDDEEDEGISNTEPRPNNHSYQYQPGYPRGPGETPPIIPGIFRIGHAGRGRGFRG